VPANFQRYLPLILIAVVLLVVLPNLLKKKTSSGPSAAARAAQTIDAISLIDEGEKTYKAAHGVYTSHLADLVVISPRLARDLEIGLGVQLDAGSDGQSFYAQVESDVLSLVRARAKKALVANSCLILKRSSGVSCPTR
jgi:hypothetical protein